MSGNEEQPLMIEEGNRSQTKFKYATFGLCLLSLGLLIGVIVLAVEYESGSSESPIVNNDVFVLTNANIYTVNVYQPTASALAVQHGKFVSVGSDEVIKAAYPDVTPFDAEGRTVIPGLTDAHVHLINLGISKQRAELYDMKAKSQLLFTLEEYYRSRAWEEGQWLLGRGWDHTLWGENEPFPTREDLDNANFPEGLCIWLTRVDGHAGWANTAAMDAAEKINTFPEEDPVGGEIIRDNNGDPTGVFVDTAMNLIRIHPGTQTTELDKEQGLPLALEECNRLGMTGVHDAGVSPSDFELFQKFVDDGKFTLRNYVMHSCFNATCIEGVEKVKDYGAHLGGGGLLDRVSIKLLIDGALGSWGAAMMDPYTDNPNQTGLLRYPTEEAYHSVVMDLVMDGWQVNTHAIGDRANKVVIDGLEAAIINDERRGGPGRHLRHRIEHSQIMRLEDIPRIVPLGILPSMQPTHATSDMRWCEERIGYNRSLGAYAWKSVLNLTGVLPLGSDFPVENPNPMWGFFSAITRTNWTGWPEGGWFPNQRLSREEALKGFTLDPAIASFKEGELGSIEAGKWADFIILDRDIMSVTEREIIDTKVIHTYLAGKKVYDAELKL